jgi:hypothetical protein
MGDFTLDEQRILDELLDAHGPRKAATLCHVVETDQPRLREIVRSLRLKGVVVCSTKRDLPRQLLGDPPGAAIPGQCGYYRSG